MRYSDMKYARRIYSICMVALVFPIVLNYLAYYGFVSAYTGNVFSEKGFLRQYDRGVFRYRILAKKLILPLHDYIEDKFKPGLHPRPLRFVDKRGDPSFYNTYYVFNTIFLCLTAGVLLWILSLRSCVGGPSGAYMRTCLLVALIALSQYVVVPYDTLSYFLLCLGILAILSARGSNLPLLCLPAIVALATLTRESSAIILSFYAACYVVRNGWRIRQEIWGLILAAGVFLAVYYGLRIVYGFDHSVRGNTFVRRQLTQNGAVSMLFFLSTLSLLCVGSKNAKGVLLFLLFSAPYIYTIMTRAIVWEVRLWLPLLIGVAVLASHETTTGKPSPATASVDYKQGD